MLPLFVPLLPWGYQKRKKRARGVVRMLADPRAGSREPGVPDRGQEPKAKFPSTPTGLCTAHHAPLLPTAARPLCYIHFPAAPLYPISISTPQP